MPDMTAGTVEMVSVEWIIQNTKYSVDGFSQYGELDYEAMLQDKCLDECFGRVVNSILTNGFRVPIVLVENYCGRGLTHGNGHHRMCAALLLGLDEIPVYWSESDYMAIDHSDTEDLLDAGDYENLHEEMGEVFYGVI